MVVRGCLCPRIRALVDVGGHANHWHAAKRSSPAVLSGWLCPLHVRRSDDTQLQPPLAQIGY